MIGLVGGQSVLSRVREYFSENIQAAVEVTH
jgi:hypothetical protein